MVLEVAGYSVGTIAQVVTAVVGTGLLGALLPFVLGYRKISLDAEGLLRTHFSDTLKDMQSKLDAADKKIEIAATRQRECEDRESRLRERVRELEDHLEGVYRMLVQTNADKVIEMSDTFPSHIVDLARRVRAYSTGATTKSDALTAAEDTVSAAENAVREVKSSEEGVDK